MTGTTPDSQGNETLDLSGAARFTTTGHIATIVSDRPEARNAVNADVVEGLERAMDRLCLACDLISRRRRHRPPFLGPRAVCWPLPTECSDCRRVCRSRGAALDVALELRVGAINGRAAENLIGRNGTLRGPFTWTSN